MYKVDVYRVWQGREGVDSVELCWRSYTAGVFDTLCRAERVTKRRRLSWLTDSVLVYEPKRGGRGGVAGFQAFSQ